MPLASWNPKFPWRTGGQIPAEPMRYSFLNRRIQLWNTAILIDMCGGLNIYYYSMVLLLLHTLPQYLRRACQAR